MKKALIYIVLCRPIFLMNSSQNVEQKIKKIIKNMHNYNKINKSIEY